MAYPRHRNDSAPTVYYVENKLVGEAGELVLNEQQMGKLSLMIRQADRLFCVDVVSFRVVPSGYSLVCSAPAGLPTPETLRTHYLDRYGKRRDVPNFDDPDVYSHWAARLRDFSCLIKNIQQRFTQWYNRVEREGRRRGTLWKSRFRSSILTTAVQAFKRLKKLWKKRAPVKRMPKFRQQGWHKSRRGWLFVRNKALPALAATADMGLVVAYVLLDGDSKLPKPPFPARLLRNAIGRKLDKKGW